jgi:hypothetical protein
MFVGVRDLIGPSFATVQLSNTMFRISVIQHR